MVQRVKEVNQARVTKAPRRCFTGESWSSDELKAHPELAVSYVTAPPRMALYMDYSTRIYNVYLRYLAPEDMHVYSIDEVFMDVTHYLGMYQMTARELAAKMISDVMKETGITATAGIGTNLYLCKIAMDIGAKHVTPDENGCAYRRTDGAVLPGTFMGSQAADRFLAGRHRNQEEAGRSRTLHDGRHCQMLFGRCA